MDLNVTVWPGNGWAGELVKDAVGRNCWTGKVLVPTVARPPASTTRMRTTWSPAAP